MEYANERLHWLLRFSALDLDHLRQGDWLNLQEDVLEFLAWPTARASEVTVEGVVTVQAEVKQALLALAHTLNSPIPHPLPTRPGSVGKRPLRRPHPPTMDVMILGEGQEAAPVLSFQTKAARTVYGVLTKNGLQLRLLADFQEEFLLAVMNVLAHVDIDYIRRCPACERIFYAAHGRQLFCSPQCASRAGTQRFRDKQRAGEEREEKAASGVGGGVRVRAGRRQSTTQTRSTND